MSFECPLERISIQNPINVHIILNKTKPPHLPPDSHG